MLDTTVEVRVPRAPAAVFAFVAEGFFDNHPRWDPAVAMANDTPGPVAVGTRGREVRRFLGRQVAEVEVTAFQPPRRFALRNRSGPFELDRAFSFEPVDGGTHIRFSFRMRPRPLPLRLLFPLLRPTISRQVHANIARLGQLLDGDHQPAQT
jgi:hypothetical protein